MNKARETGTIKVLVDGEVIRSLNIENGICKVGEAVLSPAELVIPLRAGAEKLYPKRKVKVIVKYK